MHRFADPIEEIRVIDMRFWTWLAFFIVCNVLGVEVFKAAVTLPLEEALLPGALTVPLIGLTALMFNPSLLDLTEVDREHATFRLDVAPKTERVGPCGEALDPAG